MMSKLLLMLFLTFACAVKGDKIENKEPVKLVANERNGSVEYEVYLYLTDTLRWCKFELPNGTVFQIFPENNVTDPNIEIPMLYGKYVCGMKILNVTDKYLGDYKFTANISDYSSSKIVTQPLNVVVEEKISAFPNNTYYIFSGQNVEFSLSEHLDDSLKCEITMPNVTNILNYRSPSSNFTNCLTNILNVRKEMNGTWTLKGISNITLFTQVDIIVKDIPKVEQNISVALGAKTTIILGPAESIFCQAVNPSGKVVAENSGQCIVNIDRVTQKDDGAWRVKVGLPGAITTFSYGYNIRVIDIGEQNEGEILTSYEIAQDKSFLHIECVLFVKSMKSCRIVRSDGEIFILDKGIGDGRYKYYATQKKPLEIGNDFVNCGIHVEKPNNLDMEPWKCVIVHGDNDTETGSVIDVKQTENINNTHENKIISTATLVNVSVGEQFNIVCSYPSSISYCWFNAPNGTAYSLLPGASHNHYEYYGDGLKMGHCGMKINYAHESDRGTWSCNVGTAQSKDIKQNIRVNVYNTPLVALQKYYIIKNNDYVSCKTFDNSPLEYCRFILPNGQGINPIGDSNVYSNVGTDLEGGLCRLSLLSLRQVDVGTWTCIGKPYHKNIEYYDTFYVGWSSIQQKNAMYYMFWITFGSAIALSMIILVITLLKTLNKRHRRRQTQIPSQNRSSPPPYTPSRETNDIRKIPLA